MAQLNIGQITQFKAAGDLTGHLVCPVIIFMRQEVAVAFDFQKQVRFDICAKFKDNL